jgi:hypothetical protein
MWEIEDGYCGGSRPQYTYIDADEYEECETDEEKQQLIDDFVSEDLKSMGFCIRRVEVE